MDNITQWDGPALTTLHEEGAASYAELAERNGIDQFEEDVAKAWLADALERGLIEVTGGEGDSTRYNISAKGFAVIGPPDTQAG